jgi:hypothetical protein
MQRPRALDRGSVKPALYWNATKVKGCGVRTETSDDGTQRYHLVLPKGVEAGRARPLEDHPVFLEVLAERINALEVGYEMTEIGENYTFVKIWNNLRMTNLVPGNPAKLKHRPQNDF